MENKNESGAVEQIYNPSLELWVDKDVVSLSFRRHSAYEVAGEKKGSLHGDGLNMAKTEAREWVEDMPEDADVSVFESPSFMVSGKRQEPEPHLVKPSRTRQTASIYEKAIFGSLAIAKAFKERKNDKQSIRRQRSYLLGDFMENVPKDKVMFIGDFFKTRSEVYGTDMGRFWKDYTSGHLEPRVQEALEKCGASSSKELAKNIAEFIRENSNRAEPGSQKVVKLAITHGETEEAFIYHIIQFLTQTRGGNYSLLEKLSFAYNSGFDGHIKDGQLYIGAEEEAILVGPIEEFLEYLGNMTK